MAVRLAHRVAVAAESIGRLPGVGLRVEVGGPVGLGESFARAGHVGVPLALAVLGGEARGLGGLLGLRAAPLLGAVGVDDALGDLSDEVGEALLEGPRLPVRPPRLTAADRRVARGEQLELQAPGGLGVVGAGGKPPVAVPRVVRTDVSVVVDLSLPRASGVGAFLVQAQPEGVAAGFDVEVAVLGGGPGVAAVAVLGSCWWRCVPAAALAFGGDRVDDPRGANDMVARDLVATRLVSKRPCGRVVATDLLRDLDGAQFDLVGAAVGSAARLGDI
ncbi:hypothetical protein AB0L40_18510 [Patulibacter sp. NPDC049589]|uniref:hypothetical protein n=1 Tax=Patulibacter sp. NPDC049589 TaxID=3154731 RepID=UPI003438CC84